jgi:hypothetical protein
MGRIQQAGFLLPAALTGYLWLKGRHSELPGFSCPLRALTGIPCPTCFLTRATALSLAGHPAAAVPLHAFGPPAALALLLWSVLALRSRRLLPLQLESRPLIFTAGALALYWGARLLAQFAFGLAAFPP